MRALIVACTAVLMVSCGVDDPPPSIPSIPPCFPDHSWVSFHVEDDTLCLGEERVLSVQRIWSCGKREAATDAVFETSDPYVIAIEGNRARARGRGSAELTARVGGTKTERQLVEVVSCGDAGSPPDSGADAALDATDATDALD